MQKIWKSDGPNPVNISSKSRHFYFLDLRSRSRAKKKKNMSADHPSNIISHSLALVLIHPDGVHGGPITCEELWNKCDYASKDVHPPCKSHEVCWLHRSVNNTEQEVVEEVFELAPDPTSTEAEKKEARFKMYRVVQQHCGTRRGKGNREPLHICCQLLIKELGSGPDLSSFNS